MPGEVRLWQQTFSSVNPEKLEWCFREHMRASDFFPKPSDIATQIDRYRRFHDPAYQLHRSPFTPEFEAHQQTTEYKQAHDEFVKAWLKLAGKTCD